MREVKPNRPEGANVGHGAFAAFYDQHARLVLSVATHILRDRADAEDVLQNVFFHLWMRTARLDSTRENLIGWIVTVTRNKAIDRLRARTRQAKHFMEVAPEVLQNLTDPCSEHVHVNDMLYGRELGKQVRIALARLGSAQRCAIELAFFHGLSQVEIAAKLELPVGTIKSHIRRGMLDLRRLLPWCAKVEMPQAVEPKRLARLRNTAVPRGVGIIR